MRPGADQNNRLSDAARWIATDANVTGLRQKRRRNLLTAGCLGLFVLAVAGVGAWHVATEGSGQPPATVIGE